MPSVPTAAPRRREGRHDRRLRPLPYQHVQAGDGLSPALKAGRRASGRAADGFTSTLQPPDSDERVYDPVSICGRGAFGTVMLAKWYGRLRLLSSPVHTPWKRPRTAESYSELDQHGYMRPPPRARAGAGAGTRACAHAEPARPIRLVAIKRIKHPLPKHVSATETLNLPELRVSPPMSPLSAPAPA